MARRFASIATVGFLALGLGAAHAAPTIDGNVLGFVEGYTVGYSVTIKDGGTVLSTNGQLYLHETASTVFVGFVAPLNLNDNTYGANRAADWGAKVHNLLGGGDGLEGSDKWEMKPLPGANGSSFEIKLDYIKNTSGVYTSPVERFKENGSNVDPSKIDFKTSLAYNYNQGLTQFFSADGTDGLGNPIPSPLATDGFYQFVSGAEDWVPEIMYEFSIDKAGLDWDTSLFLANLGTFHMSPNKLGSKAVDAYLGDEILPPQHDVPEPSTLLLFGAGLLGALRLRRRG